MLLKTLYNSLKVMLVLFSFVLLNQAEIAQDKTDTKSKKDFKPEASRLSMDLMKKVGFSKDKADDVRDILVRYDKEITDARKEYNKAKKENSSSISDSAKDRREGTTGYDQGFIYFKDLPPDLAKVYQAADRKANDDIVKKLSEDEDKKYERVKDSWWKEVHNAVFSHDRNMMNEKTGKHIKNK